MLVCPEIDDQNIWKYMIHYVHHICGVIYWQVCFTNQINRTWTLLPFILFKCLIDQWLLFSCFFLFVLDFNQKFIAFHFALMFFPWRKNIQEIFLITINDQNNSFKLLQRILLINIWSQNVSLISIMVIQKLF